MLSAAVLASTIAMGGFIAPVAVAQNDAHQYNDSSLMESANQEATEVQEPQGSGVDVKQTNRVKGQGVKESALKGVDKKRVKGAPAKGNKVAALSMKENQTKFDAIGVVWNRDTDEKIKSVRVRVKEQQGWSEWNTVNIMDQATGSDKSPLTGTDPLFTKDATGYEVEVVTESGNAPAGLSVSAIDPGDGELDTELPALVDEAENTQVATLSSARVPTESQGAPAATTQTATLASATSNRLKPTIVSRAAWGADEKITSSQPQSAKLQAMYLHHTATTNDYTQSSSPAQIRAIHLYHTVTLGWGDIGYQFLVDKYGTVYEGTRGSIDGLPQGAHAYGFNYNTIAITALGNYSATENGAKPSSAMTNRITQVLAWKSSQHGMNPNSTVTYTSGGNSWYRAGTKVTLPTFIPHNRTSDTGCPGPYLTKMMPTLATNAEKLIKAAGSSSYTPPAPSSSATNRITSYVVRPGDSWFSIAREFNISPDKLASLNRTTTSSVLNVGQTIKIPASPGSNDTINTNFWGPSTRVKFTDVTAGVTPYGTAVQWASDAGVGEGYNDGTFRQGNYATRLDVANFLYEYVTPSVSYSTPANDISSPDRPAVGFMTSKGAMSLNGKSFMPGNMVSRSDFAKMLAKSVDAKVPSTGVTSSTGIKDVRSTSYNSNYIRWAKEQGLMGTQNGNFYPNRAVTRGEMANALYQLFSKNDRMHMTIDAIEVNVRSTPDTKNPPIGTVKVDSYVRVLKRSGSYSYVKNESFTGWVASQYID